MYYPRDRFHVRILMDPFPAQSKRSTQHFADVQITESPFVAKGILFYLKLHELLAEDPSLKQFKSHKKSVWRLKRVGDVLTIIVVAEVLEIAWFGTDSEVLEIAWSGILVQDAVGSTISWPTHFIRFDYE
ncbi:uncharacterized protein LOC114274847 [Camellia sinensis]|uniref:uncharacterized protein LOC114274847 n=1 Tax=Camellia sinensis TaxID=4442 RepID=UPI0010362CF4|nr:uncharacterized protein LOC114274847 [Camellia sinensis]